MTVPETTADIVVPGWIIFESENMDTVSEMERLRREKMITAKDVSPL